MTNRVHTNFMKTIAIVTVLCFTVTTVSWSAPIVNRYTIATRQGKSIESRSFEQRVFEINSASSSNSRVALLIESFSTQGQLRRRAVNIKKQIATTIRVNIFQKLRSRFMKYMLFFLISFTPLSAIANTSTLLSVKQQTKKEIVVKRNAELDRLKPKILGSGYLAKNGAIGRNLTKEKAEEAIDGIEKLPGVFGEMRSGSKKGRYDIFVEFDESAVSLEKIFEVFDEHGLLPWNHLWHLVWKETRWRPDFSHVGAGGLGQMMVAAIKTVMEKWLNGNKLIEGIEANKKLLESETNPRNKKLLKAKIDKDERDLNIVRIVNYLMSTKDLGDNPLSADIPIEAAYVYDEWLYELPSSSFTPEIQKLMNTSVKKMPRQISQAQTNDYINLVFSFAFKNYLLNEVIWRQEVGAIDPSHKNAWDPELEVFSSLEILYNSGKSIKDLEKLISETLPPETRRYVKELILEYIMPLYEENTDLAPFYQIHPDAQRSDKLIKYLITQEVFDASYSHLKFTKNNKEKKQVTAFLKEFEKKDRVNRFSKGKLLAKSKLTNKDLSDIDFRGLAEELIAFRDSPTAKNEFPQTTNGFLIRLIDELHNYETLKEECNNRPIADLDNKDDSVTSDNSPLVNSLLIISALMVLTIASIAVRNKANRSSDDSSGAKRSSNKIKRPGRVMSSDDVSTEKQAEQQKRSLPDGSVSKKSIDRKKQNKELLASEVVARKEVELVEVLSQHIPNIGKTVEWDIDLTQNVRKESVIETERSPTVEWNIKPSADKNPRVVEWNINEDDESRTVEWEFNNESDISMSIPHLSAA